MGRNPDSYCGAHRLSAEAMLIQAPMDVSVADGANEFHPVIIEGGGAEKVEMEITEMVPEAYYIRLNGSRAMIAHLFKVFEFRTGKSKFIETYYER